MVATERVAARFDRDAAALAGGETRARRRTITATGRFGRPLFAAVFVKEWRGIVRDPLIMVQVAVPAIALLLPVGLAASGLGATLPAAFAVPLLVGFGIMFMGQVSASVAWLAASVEEARCAPPKSRPHRRRARRSRCWAASPPRRKPRRPPRSSSDAACARPCARS